MRSAAPKVDPAIARDLNNGNLFCLICNTQVKNKVWIAHYNGRKHRNNVLQFKTRHLAAQASPQKRPLPEEPSTSGAAVTLAKRPKEEITESPLKRPNGSAPWEKGSMSKILENSKHALRKNIIEGVPEGFFEDEKLNSRVVDTIEKQASMEQEYANFMKELDEAKQEEEQREENEEYVVAIERDIELIDEQIDQWKRVNRLELRRDELYSMPTETNGKIKQQTVEEMSDDEGADVDLTGWRSKRI